MNHGIPGLESRPAVIAEIGGNHGGDVELAKRMVEAGRDAGADAVKFQTYQTDRLLAPGHRMWQEFEKEALSLEHFEELARFSEKVGVPFLSTPFDEQSADLLDRVGVPAFKIASGDLTHHALIRYVAEMGRPVILSTGASTWAEIDQAVEVAREAGAPELLLMHCTAAYPAPDDEMNLSVIPRMRARYQCAVGLSDHSLGIELALAAVALGAVVVEKHFTTDRSLPGGDNAMSLIPSELTALAEGGRRVHLALGSREREPTKSEREFRRTIRRSLRARRDLSPGEVLSRDDLLIVRPEGGIPASEYARVSGARVRRAVDAGDPLNPEDVWGSE